MVRMTKRPRIRGALVSVVAGMLLVQQTGTLIARATEQPSGYRLGYKNDPIPSDVKVVFERLLAAIVKGDADAIDAAVRADALAFGVPVTVTNRKGNPWYGSDMNVPFLQHDFKGEVVGSWSTSKDSFTIQTRTSTFCFVRTKALGWKLYAYGDGPLQ